MRRAVVVTSSIGIVSNVEATRADEGLRCGTLSGAVGSHSGRHGCREEKVRMRQIPRFEGDARQAGLRTLRRVPDGKLRGMCAAADIGRDDPKSARW